MQGVETKWGRLGGVAKSIETVLLKLEVFLPIYRELEVIFAGLMVPLHPLPHCSVGCKRSVTCIKIIAASRIFKKIPGLTLIRRRVDFTH